MDWIVYAVITLAKTALLLFVLLTAVAYATLMERKVLGFMQLRLGPNRVGPWGLLQPLADGVKLFFKEDISLPVGEPRLYAVAPWVTAVAAITPFLAIPFADTVAPETVQIFGHTVDLARYGLHRGVVADLPGAILFILAISSLSAYGVVLGGWASDNRYSLLGGIRVTAQMISYELSLGMAVVGVLLVAGSMRLTEIVDAQARMPFIVYQPMGFILYLTAAFAETCRTPFDLIECENELVAGYHTEYSSMKFGLFQLAEYAHIITVSAIAVTLYLGGWQGPWLPSGLWFVLKTGALVFFFIWVRATYPRVRYDQLMTFGWKVLLPLSLANILVTGCAVAMWG
ncbi:NADH-quinone oxidoreductase subunit H [Desulfacinum hydrothermale DSM 13146]|uniref:NADH-quinone oxidoreductase subunit H n=1 Tax=Desulfacinum hydrothermale DSM 13146 TaxID=1121390 RepID=A0A1W1X8Z8_9BACT|nr:NADH-quinone oxidoreductase subunit NuoH [Desulfacinum hydrothermale]SMC20343.1 NADH-quinone oxidoreductase subunit H [Desulfacinum hydrothermale DSM 13146]